MKQLKSFETIKNKIKTFIKKENIKYFIKKGDSFINRTLDMMEDQLKNKESLFNYSKNEIRETAKELIDRLFKK